MKTKCLTLALLFCSTISFASEISDSKSLDGQFIIRNVVFTENDKEYDKLNSIEFKYSIDGTLLTRTVFFNDKVQNEKNIVSQEEQLNTDGKVSQYIITFTSNYEEMSGINKILEIVDNNDNILSVEYFSKNNHLFKEEFQNRFNRFPFYKISYLKHLMFDGYVDNPSKTNIGASAKYVSATSIITFLEDPIDITDKDREFINIYLKTRRADQLIPLYNKKSLVLEDNEKYYIIFQDSLLPFIIKDQKAAVSHYFGTIDDNFIMLSVGFTDIK